MKEAHHHKQLIAQGWTSMFAVFIAGVCIEIAKGGALDDPGRAGRHLGMAGIQLVLVLSSLYALMPMLVRSFDARWFRWVVVGLSVLVSLFMVAHEISHWRTDRPFGVLHALDITHHVLGAWVTVLSVRWALSCDRVTAVSSTASLEPV